MNPKIKRYENEFYYLEDFDPSTNKPYENAQPLSKKEREDIFKRERIIIAQMADDVQKD